MVSAVANFFVPVKGELNLEIAQKTVRAKAKFDTIAFFSSMTAVTCGVYSAYAATNTFTAINIVSYTPIISTIASIALFIFSTIKMGVSQNRTNPTSGASKFISSIGLVCASTTYCELLLKPIGIAIPTSTIVLLVSTVAFTIFTFFIANVADEYARRLPERKFVDLALPKIKETIAASDPKSIDYVLTVLKPKEEIKRLSIFDSKLMTVGEKNELLMLANQNKTLLTFNDFEVHTDETRFYERFKELIEKESHIGPMRRSFIQSVEYISNCFKNDCNSNVSFINQQLADLATTWVCHGEKGHTFSRKTTPSIKVIDKDTIEIYSYLGELGHIGKYVSKLAQQFKQVHVINRPHAHPTMIWNTYR